MGFRPGKAMTFLVALFLPLTLSLGVWQFNRAAEKNQVLQGLAEQSDERVEWSASEHPEVGTSISACVDVTEQRWFLDNRTYAGQVGYEVFVPAVLCGIRTPLLIRLGWIEQEAGGRGRLPDLSEPLPSGELTIEGEMRPASPEPWLTAGPENLGEGQWRMQSMVDVPDSTWEAGTPVVQLSAPERSVLVDAWEPVGMAPSRHVGYAIQWFGLAAALVICFIIWGVRRRPHSNTGSENL